MLNRKVYKRQSQYIYIRLLSVRMYIQKLLDGQGKIAANNQIAQSM